MLLVDSHEPDSIEKLMAQSVPTGRAPLNQNSMSDYFFVGADQKSRQFSRKQAGELLGDIDEAERQLRKYYNQADESYQIVEGIISPVRLHLGKKSPSIISTKFLTHPSALFSYTVEDNGFVHGEYMHDKVSATLYEAWRFRLEQTGILTVYTINATHTAKLLVSIYKNCQKPEDMHGTMQRYIKPRIQVKEHDPQVLTLMGIKGVELGEIRAKALVDRFDNVWTVLNSSVAQLCTVDGIGKTVAESLLRAVGRIK